MGAVADSKEMPKRRIPGLCERYPPMTGAFRAYSSEMPIIGHEWSLNDTWTSDILMKNSA